MTSPEPEAPRDDFEDEPRRHSRHDWRDLEKNPIVVWAKAIALGVADTAKDMVEAGREGARDAMDEGWERFDRKTKHRRE